MQLLTKKKIILLALGIIAATAWMGFMAWQKKTEAPVVEKTAPLPKINVAYSIQGFGSTPFFIAYENGYFRQHGIDVRIIPLKSGSEISLALSTEKADIGITGVTYAYNPIEKGIAIKIIAPMSQGRYNVMIRPDGKIKTTKDLEGKSMAVNQGSGKELLFRYALKKEGLNPEKIDYEDIEKAYLPVALMRQKSVDAVLANENEMDQFKKLGAIALPDWQTKYGSLKSGQTVVMINTDFLNQHEQPTRAFLMALVEAHDFIRKYPEQASIIATNHVKKGTDGALDLKPEQFKKRLEDKDSYFNIWTDPTTIVELADISYEIGQIKRRLTLEDLYDLRFKDQLISSQLEVYGQPTN